MNTLKKLVFFFGLFLFLGKIQAQTPLITNIENRESLTLNGVWKYIVDPYQTGYYDYRRDVRDEQSKSKSGRIFISGT